MGLISNGGGTMPLLPTQARMCLLKFLVTTYNRFAIDIFFQVDDYARLSLQTS